MSWGMVAGAAVSLIGGSMASRSERRGQEAQQEASEASIAEQRRQYDQTRTDQLPFLEAGYGALDRQESVLNGDYSGFMNSPDYLYARDEMQRGVERGAAARGALYNGGTNVDLARHMGGLASQNLNSYWQKLAGQAGQGQQVGSGLGQLGMGMANSIGNIYGNNAAAQASSYQRQGDIWGQTAAGVGNAFGNWFANRSAARGPGGG